MLNLNKCTKTKTTPKLTFNFKNCSGMCLSLCTAVVYNTAQNSSDNFSLLSSRQSSELRYVCWMGGKSQARNNNTTSLPSLSNSTTCISHIYCSWMTYAVLYVISPLSLWSTSWPYHAHTSVKTAELSSSRDSLCSLVLIIELVGINITRDVLLGRITGLCM